jgi:hypothetical protein
LVVDLEDEFTEGGLYVFVEVFWRAVRRVSAVTAPVSSSSLFSLLYSSPR